MLPRLFAVLTFLVASLSALTLPAGEAEKPPADQPGEYRPDLDRWRVLDDRGQRLIKPSILDPYNQNVLKGDIPIIGDNIFFVFNGVFDFILESRNNLDFKGARGTPLVGGAAFQKSNVVTKAEFTPSFELFQGDTVFQPKDWSIKIRPSVKSVTGDKNPAAKIKGGFDFEGKRTVDFGIQEGFAEVKLFEVGEQFDATSVRGGIQNFNSDFLGLVYNDNAHGVRFFSELVQNTYQINVGYFDRFFKDPFAALNTDKRRKHQVAAVNFIWNDVVPGFALSPSFQFGHDEISSHDLRAYYIGLASNGHIGRLVLNPAFYYAFGRTSDNTIDGKVQDISAFMVFVGLAYPVDYFNPRFAFVYASGDRRPRSGTATGFDSINDNINFGGGQNSYFFGEKIQLGNTTLLRGNSLYPSLRGGNATPQFENPGSIIVNLGLDVSLTPHTILEANYNFVSFANTAVLEARQGVSDISRALGYELNLGLTHRPLLNENIILNFGGAVMFPGQGIKDLFRSDSTVYKVLARMILTY
jgi:hypothetical protein